MNEYEASILESGYPYSLVVIRQTEKDNGHGETVSSVPVPIAENVRCDFSVSTNYNGNQTESTNNIKYDGLVFCRPDIDIATGDVIEISFSLGKTVQFESGEPYYYPCHLEVPVIRREARA